MFFLDFYLFPEQILIPLAKISTCKETSIIILVNQSNLVRNKSEVHVLMMRICMFFLYMLKNNCVNELEWIESKWNFTLPPSDYGGSAGIFKKNSKNNFLMVWFPPQKIKNPRIGMLLCICLAIK